MVMDILKSVWRVKAQKPQVRESPSTQLPGEAVERNTHSTSFENSQEQPDHVKSRDPKVVEFFNDFPEPYRQKAIERFSKREGLNRFDLFREMAMHQERRQALQGIFLEDQREHQEWEERQSKEQLREAFEREKELFHTREIPVWEQQVLKVVPLQPGDAMWLKLFLTANISAFGASFLFKWREFYKSSPKPPRSTLIRTFVGSFGFCLCMQVTAAYRLMDWGPFDRSVDDRQWFSKVFEQCKSDLKTIHQYLEEGSKR